MAWTRVIRPGTTCTKLYFLGLFNGVISEYFPPFEDNLLLFLSEPTDRALSWRDLSTLRGKIEQRSGVTSLLPRCMLFALRLYREAFFFVCELLSLRYFLKEYILVWAGTVCGQEFNALLSKPDYSASYFQCENDNSVSIILEILTSCLMQSLGFWGFGVPKTPNEILSRKFMHLSTTLLRFWTC